MKPMCRYLAVLNHTEVRRQHFAKVEFLHENQAYSFNVHKLAKFPCTLEEGHHVRFSNTPCNLSRNVNNLVVNE